jgi:O-antigen ligase
MAINVWSEQKLIGAGFGTTSILTDNIYYFLNKGISPFLLGKHLNNIYLEVLYETGIIGMILFLSLLFAFFKQNISTIKNSEGNDRILSICCLALLVAVGLQSFFESFILSAGNASNLMFWVLIGLVLRSHSYSNVGNNNTVNDINMLPDERS